MAHLDIIYDELKRNKIDIDWQTLSFHINTILDEHENLFRGMCISDFEQLYRGICVKNYGRHFAYLAVVNLHCYSEDNIRRNVRRAIGAYQNLPTFQNTKRVNKRKIFIVTTITLIAIYVSL
jgi:hypothetical protein